MKQCYFCTNNLNAVDHKRADVLKRFLNHHARIASRLDTGVCAKHQRKLSTAIKRARIIGMLPFIAP